jgi:hypothetical protein
MLSARRLLLLDYCVEQRGELEEAKQMVEAMQARRELLAQVFSAWRDCVAAQRRDGESHTRARAHCQRTQFMDAYLFLTYPLACRAQCDPLGGSA